MRYYDIEYRKTPESEDNDGETLWHRDGRKLSEDVTGITIEGLDLGEVYDVRVRLVDDETNAVSDWSLWPGVEIVRDDVTPPAVASIRTTKENCLTWEMDREVLHLRGFKIRHAPGVHGETEGGFGTAERVHEEIVTAPPFVLCRVPKGRRTFMIRAVDIEGNESEETTYVVTDRGPIDDQGEFLVRTEDEAATDFNGTTDGAVTPSVLQRLESLAYPGTVGQHFMFPNGLEPWMSIDGDTPMFNTDPFAAMFGEFWGGAAPWFDRDGSGDMFGGHYYWIEYVWNETVNCGEEGHLAVLSIDIECDGIGWRLQYRERNPLPMFSTDPFALMFSATGSDDMFTAQSPKPWRPWPGRLNPLGVGRYDFRLIVPGGHKVSYVTALSVSISSEARVRHVTGLSVPALGGTRVPPGDAWRKIVEVRPVAIHEPTPTQVAIVDKPGAKGPALRTYQGGVETTVIVDTVVRGY